MLARMDLNDFTLRCVRHGGRGDARYFTATLAYGGRAVAKIRGDWEEEDHLAMEVQPLEDWYWDQFVVLAKEARPEDDDAVGRHLLELAEQARQARRLQVLSLRHLCYRLVGDAPGTFQYLQGTPYSLEAEGLLRLRLGRRLETVYRRGPGARVLEGLSARES